MTILAFTQCGRIRLHEQKCRKNVIIASVPDPLLIERILEIEYKYLASRRLSYQ